MNRFYPFWLCFAVSLLLFAPLPAQQLVSVQLKAVVPLPEMVARYGFLMQYGVREYRITYTTRDVEGRPDTASGLIIYPNVPGRVFPMLAYQHGTIGEREDVPSNLRGGYEIAEVFGGLGYFSVAPDFLGLGESRGFHPYVHAASEAWAAIDMLYAAREFAERMSVALNEQLFVTGYSQGGHAAAALHRELEENYEDDFPVTASAPMSGPYSISGVMRDLIFGEEAYFYPGYLPYTVLSYNYVYKLYDDVAAIFKEPYAEMARAFFEERITLNTLNRMLIDTLTARHGGPFPQEMLQDSLRQAFLTDPDHPINRALRDNDVYEWAPRAPTRLFYCKGDDQVPFRNSVVADSVMNLLGAADLEAINLGDTLAHVPCVEPAVTSTAFFFLQYQRIGITSTGVLAGRPVSLYPNPAADYLTVQAPAGAVLELYDLQGRLYLRRLTAADPETIPVGHLAKGVYLARLQTSAGSWTGKLVKE